MLKNLLDRSIYSIIFFVAISIFLAGIMITTENNYTRAFFGISYIIYFLTLAKVKIFKVLKIPISIFIIMTFSAVLSGGDVEQTGIVFSTAISVYFVTLLILELNKNKNILFKNWLGELLTLTHFILLALLGIVGNIGAIEMFFVSIILITSVILYALYAKKTQVADPALDLKSKSDD